MAFFRVPVFADPIEWRITQDYDPITTVRHGDKGYTSIKSVPAGTDISNTEYWVETIVYSDKE